MSRESALCSKLPRYCDKPGSGARRKFDIAAPRTGETNGSHGKKRHKQTKKTPTFEGIDRRSETAGSRSLASGRSEDGELAASASPVQLLATYSGVIDDGGNLDIILGALSGLVCGGESPGPSTTVCINCKRVVRGSRNHAGLDSGNGSGLDQNTRAPSIVFDDCIFGQGVDLQAGLTAIETAPYQALAIGGPGHRVVRATTDLGDAAARERLNNSGMNNGSLVVASTLPNRRCAEAVQTPGVNFARGVDSERVVRAAANVHDILWKPEFAGKQAMELVTLDDATTELVLLPGAPREHTALVIEREDVIGTTGKMFDLLQG